MKRRLGQQNNHIENLKRAKPQNKAKGNGKGKNKRVTRAPADLGYRTGKTPQNESICFNYNRAVGCPLAKDGAACHRGRHVCIECYGNHSLTLLCPKLSR